MKTAKVKAEETLPIGPLVPTPAEVKQVLAEIMQQFVNEEAGNKVTRNNMAGLIMQIHGAIDGQITIQQKEGNTP